MCAAELLLFSRHRIAMGLESFEVICPHQGASFKAAGKASSTSSQRKISAKQ
jgi:hypothetical protein